jgi:hypothetical protein
MAISTSDIDALPDWTTAQELKAVKNAIIQIEMSGQSYTLGSRSLSRADLGALYSEKRRLERQLQAETGVDTSIGLARLARAK